jgi:hypothetical protein
VTDNFYRAPLRVQSFIKACEEEVLPWAQAKRQGFDDRVLGDLYRAGEGEEKVVEERNMIYSNVAGNEPQQSPVEPTEIGRTAV